MLILWKPVGWEREFHKPVARHRPVTLTDELLIRRYACTTSTQYWGTLEVQEQRSMAHRNLVFIGY